MLRILVCFGLMCMALPLLTGCGEQVTASTPSSAYTPRLKQVDVEVAPARRQALATEVEFTGNLLPRRMTRVMAEVEAVVREIPKVGTQFDVVVEGRKISERLGITFGQSVKQGDVLVQLDTADFEISLRMAEAKLSKAQADLAKLKSWQRPEELQRLVALRDEAKSRYDLAVRQYGRDERLAKSNVVTRSEIEITAMEVSTSRASLQATEAVLAQAQAGPTKEELAVQQALIAEAAAEVQKEKRIIEKGTIRAPYDGVVTAFSVEVGDRVSPGGEPLVELMDLRFLVAEVAIPESYIGRVQVKDQATVTAAGTTDPVPGLVIAINDMVDPQARTFDVRVAIDNERRKFKAGQFASVQLRMGGLESEALTVPSRAIFLLEGQPHVYILKGDVVESTRVGVGVANADTTEILNGLQDGDVVIVDDPSLLSDGMTVSVRETASVAATQ